RVCLRLPAYSASAKVICFMEKLGWRDRRISPDSGSLFQTFPNLVKKDRAEVLVNPIVNIFICLTPLVPSSINGCY
ncbi:hypothetical protein JTM10_22890, partial [Pseudomonas aeruginosa]|nr:hypothetical protein [Pseudomonas aeruginosa]